MLNKPIGSSLDNKLEVKPVFLLQSRQYNLTFCPSWVGHDGEGFWIEPEYLPDGFEENLAKFVIDDEVDDVLLYKFLIEYQEDDTQYCVESWRTESVWFDKEKAKEYAWALQYRYKNGYRIFEVKSYR